MINKQKKKDNCKYIYIYLYYINFKILIKKRREIVLIFEVKFMEM